MTLSPTSPSKKKEHLRQRSTDLCKWLLDKYPQERSKPIEYSLSQGSSPDPSSVKSCCSKAHKARGDHENSYWLRRVSLGGGVGVMMLFTAGDVSGVLKPQRFLPQPSGPCCKPWETVSRPESAQWQWRPRGRCQGLRLEIVTVLIGQDTFWANQIVKQALFCWNRKC